jgi:hypothetical protein
VGGAWTEILAQGMSIPIIDSKQYSHIGAALKAAINPVVYKSTSTFMPMSLAKNQVLTRWIG